MIRHVFGPEPARDGASQSLSLHFKQTHLAVFERLDGPQGEIVPMKSNIVKFFPLGFPPESDPVLVRAS
jgi:hypothetical protein